MDTYEKKYKAALERAKQFSEKPYLEDSAGIVEYIFPELKEPELAESEDKRIRKEIRDFICWATDRGCITKEQVEKSNSWLAWLDKQGETSTEDFGEFINILSKRFPEVSFAKLSRIAVRVKKWLEKQASPVLSNSSNVGKVESKPAELPKGEDYGIDGLWHAINILQRTLGEVEGYQSDDGILEHKCAISAVKELYERKPAWGEEDENTIKDIIEDLEYAERKGYVLKNNTFLKEIHWLKTLKDRVQPQPSWGQEDKEHIESILKRLDGMCKKGATFTETCFAVNQDMDWLKSLRPQMHWKPTKEQMDALWRRIAEIKISDERPSDIYILGELYEQLENL